MSSKLSDGENALMGMLCGSIEISCLQPLNYLKNVSQQKLTPQFHPRVLYRGYLAGVLNMGSCTMIQMAACGKIESLITEKKRPATDMESVAIGFAGGVVRFQDFKIADCIVLCCVVDSLVGRWNF
jgi:hypothetical protein